MYKAISIRRNIFSTMERNECREMTKCFEEILSNENSCNNGESVENICYFILNCLSMGFRIQTWSYMRLTET